MQSAKIDFKELCDVRKNLRAWVYVARTLCNDHE